MRAAVRSLTVILALASFALAGCGGGKSTNSQAGTSMSKGAPMSEAQREANALPNQVMAPVPRLNCGAVKPVWVNLKSRAYHEAGDPYYGRTKNGEYLCPSQAVAQGFHPAGATRAHHRKAGSMSGNQINPQASPSY